MAARFHGDPSSALPVVGITGTNGKTTTTFLLERIAVAGGLTPAVLGTLGLRWDGAVAPGRFTTPEATDLQRTLADLQRDGADLVVMEVSSHALSEHRVDGTRFAVACFTNLSQEHLDHHGTMDKYFATKARLFTPVYTDRAVVNLDDAHGPELAARARADGLAVTTYGIEATDAHVRGTELRPDTDGTTFALSWPDHTVDARVALPGRFNVANALAAAATATVMGIAPDAVVAGLASPGVVPGRFEIVASDPVTVIVDYAHTPEGVSSVIGAARELGTGRVVAVFGCGGDRDAEKRPAMGVAAGRGADLVVLTTDNPRSEDPATIAAAAEAGLRAVDARYSIELDRRAAIRAAIAAAAPGDTILILGKGAEPAADRADRRLEFDDRVVAAEELESVWS